MESKNKKVIADKEISHSPLLEKAKREESEFKVPLGYFDALGSRIIDRIHQEEAKTHNKSPFIFVRKPLVWSPILLTGIAAILFIFIIPPHKTPAIIETNIYSEMNMAYDASYAEEVLFSEAYTNENELEILSTISSVSVSENGINGLSDEEIKDYLTEQDLNTDIISEN